MFEDRVKEKLENAIQNKISIKAGDDNDNIEEVKDFIDNDNSIIDDS